MLTETQINNFFSNTSFAGLLSLYVMKLSLEKKTAFDRNDFSKHVKIVPSDYLYGFIVACSSFEMLSYNNKGPIITVLSMNPIVQSKILPELNRMAENEENWKNYIQEIVKYFD